MYPAKQSKLLFQVAFLERHNKSHESDVIESKADDTMICCEWKKLRVGKNNMLHKMLAMENRVTGKTHFEVVDDTFAV